MVVSAGHAALRVLRNRSENEVEASRIHRLPPSLAATRAGDLCNRIRSMDSADGTVVLRLDAVAVVPLYRLGTGCHLRSSAATERVWAVVSTLG